MQLCDPRLNLTENVGTLVNAAWNNGFAACVLACNDRTHSFGGDAARADLYAWCYREFGLAGARIALVGVPTELPDPASKLLDAIEEVELEQGLPHPTLNGVWIKRAPERFYSYLMAHRVGEHNIDQVIPVAEVPQTSDPPREPRPEVWRLQLPPGLPRSRSPPDFGPPLANPDLKSGDFSYPPGFPVAEVAQTSDPPSRTQT